MRGRGLAVGAVADPDARMRGLLVAGIETGRRLSVVDRPERVGVREPRS